MATQTLRGGAVIGQIDYPLILETDASPSASDGVGIQFRAASDGSFPIKHLATIQATATDVDFGQIKGKLSFLTNDQGGDALVERLSVDDSGQMLVTGGSGSAPAYAFGGDADTGMTSGGTNVIAFVTGASSRVNITTTALIMATATAASIQNEASSATNPTLIPDRTELGSGIGGTANGVSVIALSTEMIDVTSTTVVFPLGYQSTAQSLTPAADGSAGSVILPNTTAVAVGAVTNDANDWILLPLLASVPVGHTIKIACNAGGAFEIRTPASSSQKINTVDSDGSAKELTCVDTELVVVESMGATDGWIARSFTALGADNGALVPSA